MEKIKEFLRHKGWIATVLGSLIGFPIGIAVVIKYFQNPTFTQAELWTVAVILGLAMAWVILPTKISIEAGTFRFNVED